MFTINASLLFLSLVYSWLNLKVNEQVAMADEVLI